MILLAEPIVLYYYSLYISVATHATPVPTGALSPFAFSVSLFSSPPKNQSGEPGIEHKDVSSPRLVKLCNACNN
jgi:hypothetical protein